MTDTRTHRSTTPASANVELVRDAFEHWIRGEHESVLAVIDPDAEIVVASAPLAGGQPFRGHQGYRQWTETMEESFDVWEVHPEIFHERGHTVVVLGHAHLRGRGSGVELDQETGWLVDVHDGKITRFQALLSHQEALAVGGIS